MRCLFALACAPALFAAPALTFNKDIAPIIYNNCSSCHRPGEAAPFALLSYSDVKKRGALIASVTESRYMPPWKAEPVSYKYRDERRLSDSEIATIRDWVKQGMPEGTGAAPTAPKFTSGWRLGEPDLIVEMPAAYRVPADGPDIYRNIALRLGLTEDKWVTAIDMRLTARQAVHHVLYFGDPSGKSHDRNDADQPGFSGMRPGGNNAVALGGWAVGAQPHFFPEGLALRVPKGSDLVIQYHFHPAGKTESEKSVVGLYFAKQPPARRLISVQMPPVYSLFSGLDIPAGDKDFVIRDSYVLPAAMDAVGAGAHAHYLAKRMKMTATFPDGEVKTLLSIGDWDFAWQDRYYFDHLVELPKGTRLDAEIHWDNSAANTRNPSNPPVRVEWGEQSKDEMGSVSLLGVPHDQADWGAIVQDVQKHRDETIRTGIRKNPALMKKVNELLSQ